MLPVQEEEILSQVITQKNKELGALKQELNQTRKAWEEKKKLVEAARYLSSIRFAF